MSDVIEWTPMFVPTCARCNKVHWSSWYTWLDGAWVADGCLSDEERATFRHVEDEKPRGKIDLPKVGK